jgi:hypothetical protein
VVIHIYKHLGQVALMALTNAAFTSRPSRCQQFVRECTQYLWGSQFNAFHQPSARLSLRAWKKSPYFHETVEKYLPGDILYWADLGSGAFGHTAIVIEGELIAENSIRHHNGEHGSKGVRRISQIRKPQGVVRLPFFGPPYN